VSRQALKIGIVGAGPGGLYFALLMKKLNPVHQITIVEQNPAGATYGWGVVFSGKALSFLRDYDQASFAEIQNAMEIWDDLTIIQKDEPVKIDGSRYSGIARLNLLQILQKHCRQHGVNFLFEQKLIDLEIFKGYDLVIGADGVNSLVRQTYADYFQPSTGYLTNKYIWYGTNQLFDTLSLIFREYQGGSYVAHCYRYSDTASTFIVECDAKTWENAGFEGMDELQSRLLCEKIFAKDLGGKPLLLNKSAWLNFRVVTNQNWVHGNTVLIGDALRSVHFSIGSGTRMALEDAIALYKAFVTAEEDVPEALELFEQAHRPSVTKMLDIARHSYVWYESFHEKMHLAAIPFAYDYMSRSGRITDEMLRERAPRFAAMYEVWQNNL
jgi:anthraniloyl-CoA monooxygenase